MTTAFTRLLHTTLIGLLGIAAAYGQETTAPLPEMKLDRAEISAQLHFLASDFLAGRRTGSPGNDIAAEYIAATLQAYGYVPPAGQDNFFQDVPFVANTPPQSASLVIGKETIPFGDNFLLLSGGPLDIKADIVYAGHGWVDADKNYDDYRNLDVTGKIVVVLPGEPEAQDPGSIFRAASKKRQLAAERGAVALIELYRMSFPWAFFRNYFSQESMRLDQEPTENAPNITYGWMKEPQPTPVATLQTGKRVRATLSSNGAQERKFFSRNVIGVLSGSDPVLRNEYILLTAHYDHVGVGKQGGGAYTPADSIFNGARDNAFGVTALLAAAKALALERPKRSVIVMALTAEEVGLLGSEYYANNPVLPLQQTIFNLNTDGAGYNVTDAVSVIGWNRTGVDSLVTAAARTFNMRIITDPAPEQGLFDRSDNVSFARQGVPCITFSPAFEEFNEEVMQYYHQVSDEVGSIDMNYVHRFCQAYAHTARLLANMQGRPQWAAGDKYEAAGKALYGE